jgi:hypothetical protein
MFICAVRLQKEQERMARCAKATTTNAIIQSAGKYLFTNSHLLPDIASCDFVHCLNKPTYIAPNMLAICGHDCRPDAPA